jgi:hypothetical protein
VKGVSALRRCENPSHWCDRFGRPGGSPIPASLSAADRAHPVTRDSAELKQAFGLTL